METVETVETPLSLVSESAAESANVESAAAVPVDSSIAAAALNTFNVHPCAIVNATTIMSGNMEEEVPPLSSAPRADATDASTTTDAGSAREDTANGQASLSINRVDTAISSTRTNTQRRTASWDHGTSSPSSGDNAESEAVASVHHSDHAAATTTEMTTTTTLSNSLETSTHATDKDGSAYVQALLSAIATVPATDNVLAGRAATSSGDAVYRLPNGQVITSKNTLQSHSTAATGSNSSNRRSDSDHGDEGESHHVRGVPVPSTPLSATASPILVSVVHVTQDHAGTASSSPPILAAVVADTNEPIDHGTATGGDNDDASKSRVKKLRIFAVVVFAILLIAVSLFATFYWIKAASQSRATAVTNYIKNITLSTMELTIPTAFQFQNSLGKQAALDWLVNYDPLKLWPDSDLNRFRLKQRYALLTFFLGFLDFNATSFIESECEWTHVANCDSKSTEPTTLGADVVTAMIVNSGEQLPGLTLSPDLGLLGNLVTFRVEKLALMRSLLSSLEKTWTNLATFAVSGNALTGSLPSSLGAAWANLTTFDASFNVLAGSLPSSFGRSWTNLKTFDVSGNALNGSLPSLFGATWTNLATFDVLENDLVDSPPSSLGTTWANLVTFDVSSNYALRGSLPSSLGTTWTNLEEFYVSGDTLTGSLPPFLGSTWTNLKRFDVYGNVFRGSLPSLLGTTWTNLATFDVSYNALTGSLPASLGMTWTNLATFDVSYNALTGSLPSSLGVSWTNLESFDVSDNALTGSLPPLLGTTWPNLTMFDMSSNVFARSIPLGLGTTWTNLATFDVSSNDLTGSLPPSLGTAWTHIESFHVSGNALTGTIPNLASNWTNLQGAYFHFNNLVGSISSGFCVDSLWVDCIAVICDCCDICCSDDVIECQFL